MDWLGQEFILQGLKPDSLVRVDARAEARAYLGARAKARSRSLRDDDGRRQEQRINTGVLHFVQDDGVEQGTANARATTKQVRGSFASL